MSELDVRADAVNIVAAAINDDPRAQELASAAAGDKSALLAETVK